MATTPFSVCKEFCAGGGGASNAKDVKYDNTNTELAADNVGGAIDEICDIIDNVTEDVTELDKVTAENIEQTDANTRAMEQLAGSVSNALKGSAIGNPITISDVSPVEHEVQTKVYQKNMFDVKSWFPTYVNDFNGMSYSNKDFATVKNVKILEGKYTPNTQYTFSCDYELTAAETNGIAMIMYDVSGAAIVTKWLNVTGSQTGHASITNPINTSVAYISLLYSTTNKVCDVVLKNMQINVGAAEEEFVPYIDTISVKRSGRNLFPLNRVFTFPADNKYSLNCNISAPFALKCTIKNEIAPVSPGGGIIQLVYSDGTTDSITPGHLGAIKVGIYTGYVTRDNGKTITKIVFQNWCEIQGTVSNVIISPGTTEPIYEPYAVEPTTHIADENGNVEGITSLYPTTVLTSDKGVTISAEYNRDINKAFAELQNAILTLGGNV